MTAPMELLPSLNLHQYSATELEQLIERAKKAKKALESKRETKVSPVVEKKKRKRKRLTVKPKKKTTQLLKMKLNYGPKPIPILSSLETNSFKATDKIIVEKKKNRKRKRLTVKKPKKQNTQIWKRKPKPSPTIVPRLKTNLIESTDKITLFIQALDEEIIMLTDLSHNSCILDVKNCISERQRLGPQYVCLFFNGKFLEDGDTLQKCGIQNKSTLSLELNLSTFKVFIQTITGQKIILGHLHINDTIEKLKSAIQTKEGYPVDEQRLIFAHQRLEDKKTLGSYKICNDSTLYLILYLRAGIFHYTSGKTDHLPLLVPPNDFLEMTHDGILYTVRIIDGQDTYTFNSIPAFVHLQQLLISLRHLSSKDEFKHQGESVNLYTPISKYAISLDVRIIHKLSK